MNYYILAIAIVAGLSSSGVYAAENIRISSAPEGATFCKKVLRRVNCIGKTPVTLDLDMEGIKYQTPYVLRKIGYQPAEIYIGPDSENRHIKLTIRDFLGEPTSYKDKNLSSLQLQINNRLDKLIYGSDLDINFYFDFLGKVEVYEDINGRGVIIPIFLNEEPHLKKIRKATRTQGEKRKHQNVIKVFRETGYFDLFSLIIGELNGLAIKSVTFTVSYSRTKAVLDFNKVTKYVQRYSHSTYQKVGGYTYQTDHFDIIAKTQDVTVVKDAIVTSFYAIEVPLGKFNIESGEDIAKHIESLRILTNENRRHNVEKINQ